MKRYFVDGKEITAAQAQEIERKNHQYIESGNFDQLAKVKFIVVI